jgi:small subunit ribosomal protein S2
MPYVKNRWLGGTLTNFETISKRSKRLEQIEEMESSGIFEKLTKKEVLKIKKEYEKLLYNMGGIRGMKRIPDILYVVDPSKEEIAVKEAVKLGIPIVAITDTNCDPDNIEYVVPGNDDAIRSCELITKIMSNAVREGKEQKVKIEESPEKKESEKAGKEIQEDELEDLPEDNVWV